MSDTKKLLDSLHESAIYHFLNLTQSHSIMTKHVKSLKEELDSIGRFNCFEIEIEDANGERHWLDAEVNFRGNSIVATRIGLSSKEERSRFIARDSIVADSDSTLQQLLEDLHEAILQSILDGDLYTLAQDDEPELETLTIEGIDLDLLERQRIALIPNSRPYVTSTTEKSGPTQC